ncbi:MAG: GNAT family N-acetyltransferase [Cellulosilyticaceae bacterium]
MQVKNIETSRLLLRGFTKGDALWAYSIWNNPEMGKYLPDEAKEEIDDEAVKELEDLGEDEECCYLIPVLKNSLERLGTCSFIMSEDKEICDIAYCVHKDFWCKGYATEIAQGMIDYARSQGAKKVTIFVNQENIASNRVAQKCGGEIVSERTYKKRGTDIMMKDYKYEVVL